MQIPRVIVYFKLMESLNCAAGSADVKHSLSASVKKAWIFLCLYLYRLWIQLVYFWGLRRFLNVLSLLSIFYSIFIRLMKTFLFYEYYEAAAASPSVVNKHTIYNLFVCIWARVTNLRRNFGTLEMHSASYAYASYTCRPHCSFIVWTKVCAVGIYLLLMRVEERGRGARRVLYRSPTWSLCALNIKHVQRPAGPADECLCNWTSRRLPGISRSMEEGLGFAPQFLE